MSDSSSIGNESFHLNSGFTADPSLLLPGLNGVMPFLMTSSSISQSEQTSNTVSLNSNSPQLALPIILSNVSEAQNAGAEAILQGWQKQLEDEARIVKEYLNSPAYLNKLQEHSVGQMAKNESKSSVIDSIPVKNATNVENFVTSVPIQVAYDFLKMNNYIGNPSVAAVVSEATKVNSTASTSSSSASALANPAAVQAPSKAPEVGAAHFITASLILGAGVTAVSQASVDPTGSTLNMQSKVITDAHSAIIPLQEQGAATLVASWFSSMWGVATLSQTSAQQFGKLKDAPTGNAKKYDVEYAKSYANSLSNQINTPDFERILLFLVSKSQENVPVNKQSDSQNVLAQSKIVLLSVALALVSKLDVAGKEDEGWFNELEFEGSLKSNPATLAAQEDPNNTASTKQKLITEINIELSKLSPTESSMILANLKTYFRSLPSTEDLLNQEKALANVMPNLIDPDHFGINLLNTKPV